MELIIAGIEELDFFNEGIENIKTDIRALLRKHLNDMELPPEGYERLEKAFIKAMQEELFKDDFRY